MFNLFQIFKNWNNRRKILKQANLARKRVSGYSQEKRDELFSEGLKRIYPMGHKTCFACNTIYSKIEQCPRCFPRKYGCKGLEVDKNGQN